MTDRRGDADATAPRGAQVGDSADCSGLSARVVGRRRLRLAPSRLAVRRAGHRYVETDGGKDDLRGIDRATLEERQDPLERSVADFENIIVPGVPHYDVAGVRQQRQ